MYYNARYYDRTVGHFASPDTLVPDPTSVWDYNRFGYGRLNPLKYNDPTGHYSDQALMTHFGCETWQCVEANFREGGAYAGLWGWLDVLKGAEDGDYIRTVALYDRYGAEVTGQFATVDGKIIVNYPTVQVGEIVGGTIRAPASKYAGSFSDLDFARTVLIGGGDPSHQGYYLAGRKGSGSIFQWLWDNR
jgi:hypothetical protein